MLNFLAYAALVKQKRGAKKLSQENLATDALGDPARKGEISRLENGKTKPHETTIQKINAVLDITEAEMLPIRQSMLTSSALDDIPGLMRRDLEDLAARFHIENPYDQNDAQLRDMLTKRAEDFRALRKEVDDLKLVSPRLANQHAAAMDALNQFRVEEAEEILENAREVVRDQLREPLEINAQLMEAQAAAALLRGDVNEAYRTLCIAADSFGSIDPLEPTRKRIEKYCARLQSHGARYGGSGLLKCIDMMSPLVSDTLKSQDEDLWKQGQNNLAIATQTYGRRVKGAKGRDFLSLSISAYEALLSAATDPQSLALVQINMATSLFFLGKKTGGSAGEKLLARAISAQETGLTVFTKASHSEIWAGLKNNLGLSYLALGERSEGASGNSLIEQAVSAFEDGLPIMSAHPWKPVEAGNQQNLGEALQALGIRTPCSAGLRYLNRAILALQAALEITTKEAHPLSWAESMEFLAVTKESIADHAATDDPRPHLKSALAHSEDVLTIYDSEHMSGSFERATCLRDRVNAKLDALAEKT